MIWDFFLNFIKKIMSVNDVYGFTSMGSGYGYDSSSDSDCEPSTPQIRYTGKDLILSPAARACKFSPHWYHNGKDLNLTAHTWYILLTELRPLSLIYGSGLGRFCDTNNIPFEDEKTLRQFRSEQKPVITKLPTRCKFVNMRGRRCDWNARYKSEYCLSHDPIYTEINPLPNEITQDIEEFKKFINNELTEYEMRDNLVGDE